MDDEVLSVSLLPGFRFYPTQEELVSFYLHHKLNGTRPDIHTVIPVIHIYDHNPWDLPRFGGEFCGEDNEQWFFFNPRQEREARGGRTNRMTTAGYWKATGSPSYVYSYNNNNNSAIIIGTKRTMVFYVGKAPHGTKTIWKMNEYKAVDCSSDQAASSSSSAVGDHHRPQLREEISLCRIYTGSRSIRAFDRLPIITSEAAVHYHCDGSSSSSPPAAQNPSQSSVEINNGNSTNTGGVASEPDGGEPCWDSELFNWFYI